MTSIPSGSGFKIDTSGLSEARALTSGAMTELEEAGKEATKLAGEMAEERNAIKDSILTSFSNIPEGQDPLDAENFNDIINTLVKGEDDNDNLSTEATEHLKSVILATIGKQNGVAFSDLDEVNAHHFINVLTQIFLDYYGDDKELSTEEFETFLSAYDFQGAVSTPATSDTENDEDASSDEE